MRLTFSSTDHLNTDISDERGYVYYTVSTPGVWNKVTTITKYQWTEGRGGEPEKLGEIAWHRWGEAMVKFGGREMGVDEMLFKRSWNNGRFFRGPDGKTYKWKLESHCWMKPAESDLQLARFHRKNAGIMKPAHPPYLDVSDRMAFMLDHIVFTFVYAESLRISRQRQRANMAAGTAASAAAISAAAAPPPSC